MNILYIVHPSEQHTATHAHTVEVIANLRKLGHTVSTLQVSRSPVYNTLSAQSKPLWIRVLSHTPVKWLYRRFKGELALLYLTWVELGLAARLLLKPYSSSYPPPDVLYSRHRWLNGAELLFSKLTGKPYIREINGFVADEMVVRKAGDGLSVWLFNKIERWNLRRGDRWIAVTTRIKVTLHEEYGVPKKKIAVVENGVNTELFCPEDHPYVLATADKRVCFVGQLWEHQKLEALIEAMKLVDATLVIVGDGPIEGELFEQATGKIVFKGRLPQEHVPMEIGNSAVCVGPFTEGWYNKRIGRSALKLCEYLACGKPVVCSRTEGTEFIEKEGLGVLVDNLEPETIASAINTLLGYPELRIEMGRKARKYVVENRSWEKAAGRIAEVMEEACTA